MTATFYTGSPGNLSNGHSWSWACRHYHGRFAACNRYALGTRLLLSSRSGRRVVVTVADRGGARIGVDLAPGAMRELAGVKYRIVGRLSVRVRKVGR